MMADGSPRVLSPHRYGTRVEVDYRGKEVTVETFLRVLTGAEVHPRIKRLTSFT